jgi:hypothetical protein
LIDGLIQDHPLPTAEDDADRCHFQRNPVLHFFLGDANLLS